MRIVTVVVSLILGLFQSSGVAADPHPRGFRDSFLNGPLRPLTESGVTSFQLLEGMCSEVHYGDDRGESDCDGGSLRATLDTDPVSLGNTVEYRFDVWIDPKLDYSGYLNPTAGGYLPDAWDSMLNIATWEGNNLHNFLYLLKADTTKGLTFHGEQCQPPEAFGEWVTFSMKVRWANDERGWIKVSCDDQLIYVREALATNQAPHCWILNQCEVGIFKNPDRFMFVLGPTLGGATFDMIQRGHSKFMPVQADGINVKMRNMAIIDTAVLYEPEDVAAAKTLQARLNELGCDVGAVDGVPGRKTREAAISCRDFGENVLPSELNVATLPAFVEAYSRPDAASLPAGSLPEPEPVFRVAEDGPYGKSPDDPVVDSYLRGKVQGYPKGRDGLAILITGPFDKAAGHFVDLAVMIDSNLGPSVPEALEACPNVRLLDWGDGYRAGIVFNRAGDAYIATGGACIVDALPEPARTQAGIVVNQFRLLAASMQRDGTIELMQREEMRGFMRRVAAGEVVIGLP